MISELLVSGHFKTQISYLNASNFLDARSEGTGTGTIEEHSDASNLSKCMIAIRRFFTFIFSHVGLLSMVMGYCILGGITFEHLEKDHELQVQLQSSVKCFTDEAYVGQERHG